MTSRTTIIGIFTLLWVGAALPTAFVRAQETPTSVAGQSTVTENQTVQKEITVQVGDVFEIMADSGVDGATYSWILTQERTFIEAGRERLFRYRFVQDKTYTLRADILLPNGSGRMQQAFTIRVLLQGDPRVPAPSQAGTGASLAGTIPAADENGRVILSDSEHVLRLAPVRTDISPLALDIDSTRDSDGDGNPGNDIDNANTYFHLFGRSLWIWFARPLTSVDLIITAAPAGTSPLVQHISVLNEKTARGQGVLTSPVTIQVEQIDQASFSFSPKLTRPVATTSPLLYEWEFGDGERSLETNPTHQYVVNGTVTVKLHIRDLQTGSTVGRAEQTISPIIPTPSSAPSSEQSSEDPDIPPPEEPTQRSNIPWGRVLLIGGIFAGALCFGILIVWLLSFFRRSRKIEHTLASIERVVAPSKDVAPPPLAIKSKPQSTATTGQQKVIDAEINAASSPPESATPIKEELAPDWLKKGLTPTDQKKSQPSPTSVPPTPKPARAEPSNPPPSPGPLPTTVTKPSPPPAAATPKAAPVQPLKQQTPAPITAPKPTNNPPPSPAIQTPGAPPAANLPRWLQPQTNTEKPLPSPAPKTMPTPPAPKPTAGPTIPRSAPTSVSAPVSTPVPIPTPASAPAPTPAPTQTTPSPAPSPLPTPTPPPASMPTGPAAMTGSPAAAPTPKPAMPPTTQTARTTQPLSPTPLVQPKPVPPPSPVITPPTPPLAVAPTPTPQPLAPASGIPATTVAPKETTTIQVIPPKPPSQTPAPTFDDDQPFAIIRAENINPGPGT